MAKKDEQLTAQQAAEAQASAQEPTAAVSETPNRDAWFANMRGKYGEDKSDEELFDLSSKGYDKEHEYAKQARSDVNEFAEAIKNNPQLLPFYQKVIELGADNAEMALLELGDDLVDLLTGNIDSEAYQEKKRRKAESDAESSRLAEEKSTKQTAQRAALEAWAEKKGINPDEFVGEVQSKLLDPLAAFSAEEALFDSLYNMIYHDEDVEAARVQGRNEKIVTERKKNAGSSDGQVNRSSAAAGADKPVQKSRLATIRENREYARNL